MSNGEMPIKVTSLVFVDKFKTFIIVEIDSY